MNPSFKDTTPTIEIEMIALSKSQTLVVRILGPEIHFMLHIRFEA